MQVSRILLPLAGASIDADTVRLAAAIARPVKAALAAVYVIEVQWNQPLDAVLEDDVARGEQLLTAAQELAQSLGAKLETELVQARTAWSAIVDVAQRQQADLIVIGMPYRKRLGKVAVGKTVQNVFVNAPCQVIALREAAPEFAVR